MNTAAVSSIKSLALVWAALLALLAITAGSAFMPLGVFNPIINLVIAAAKMLLVMVFFMHLKIGSGLLRLVAAAGFFWLLLLVGLVLSDYLTRHPVPAPW